MYVATLQLAETCVDISEGANRTWEYSIVATIPLTLARTAGVLNATNGTVGSVGNTGSGAITYRKMSAGGDGDEDEDDDDDSEDATAFCESGQYLGVGNICAQCHSGTFKTGYDSATSCASKLNNCTAGEILALGNDAVVDEDDRRCTACEDGSYTDSATTCKRKQYLCQAGSFFTAGKPENKSADDTLCTQCPSGTYTSVTSTAVNCTAKRTDVDCGSSQEFLPGANSATTDDTACVTCSDGQYKNTDTRACTAKRTAVDCGQGDIFTAGRSCVKDKDDTQCAAPYQLQACNGILDHALCGDIQDRTKMCEDQSKRQACPALCDACTTTSTTTPAPTTFAPPTTSTTATPERGIAATGCGKDTFEKMQVGQIVHGSGGGPVILNVSAVQCKEQCIVDQCQALSFCEACVPTQCFVFKSSNAATVWERFLQSASQVYLNFTSYTRTKAADPSIMDLYSSPITDTAFGKRNLVEVHGADGNRSRCAKACFEDTTCFGIAYRAAPNEAGASCKR